MPDLPDPLPEPAPAAGFWQLATAIWHEPSVVGEAVLRRVPWVAVALAAAVIMTIMIGATWLCRAEIVSDTLEMLRARSDVPAEQLETMTSFFAGPTGQALLVAQNAVGSIVGFLLIGVGLYLGQLIMGGRASFGQSFAVAVFSCLISFGAGWLLRTVLVLQQGSFLAVSTGLGALVDAPFHDPWRSLLDLLDPFHLWAVAAAGIALAPPARLARGQAMGVAVAVYLLLGGLGALLRIAGGS